MSDTSHLFNPFTHDELIHTLAMEAIKSDNAPKLVKF